MKLIVHFFILFPLLALAQGGVTIGNGEGDGLANLNHRNYLRLISECLFPREDSENNYFLLKTKLKAAGVSPSEIHHIINFIKTNCSEEYEAF